MIHEPVRQRIEKYITGIVQNPGHKVLAIYCMPDHLHLFVGFRPAQSIADFMREVKSRSTVFINEEKLLPAHFQWQEGYGAFSYSKSHVQKVIDYVFNQPEHHKNETFKDEYIRLLKKFEIAYEDRYLFEWME